MTTATPCRESSPRGEGSNPNKLEVKAEDSGVEDEEGDDQDQEDGDAGFADELEDSPDESSDEDPRDLDFEPSGSRKSKRRKTSGKARGKSRR